MRAELLQPAATITAALLRNEQTVGPNGVAEMLVAVYDQLVLAQQTISQRDMRAVTGAAPLSG
jgi:hypothetical protein